MSSRKVYWKFLRIVLKQASDYIQRNQLQLKANVTGEVYDCIVSTLDSILVCLAALPENTPT